MTSRLRKVRWWGWTGIAILIAAAAGGGFVGVEHAQAVALGSLSPRSGSYLVSHSVVLSASLPGYRPGRGQISLVVDGIEIASSELSLKSDLVTADLTIPDGQHTAGLTYNSSDVFSRRLVMSTSFVVDTIPPVVSITAPSPQTSLGGPSFQCLASFNEPVKSATLTLDGKEMPLTVQSESAETVLNVAQGTHQLGITATDLAGNSSTKQWQVLAEFDSPVVSLGAWPGATWKQASGTVDLTVEDAFPSKLVTSATLDGEPVPLVAVGSAADQAASNAPGQSYQLSAAGLAEGQHELQVQVTNAGGHTASLTQSFLVSTGASLGSANLTSGAVGVEVTEVQQILVSKGFFKGKPSGVFDSATQQAVNAYEQAQGLVVTLGLDKNTAQGLLGLIVVDQAKCQLYLYEGSKLVKTYTVAVGQPAWPTPIGNFVIISKQIDPTWYPPDSSWAAGAKPIGPGPSDPLQARVMWLSAPAVGIHGTNEPWSVGVARLSWLHPYAGAGCRGLIQPCLRRNAGQDHQLREPARDSADLRT